MKTSAHENSPKPSPWRHIKSFPLNGYDTTFRLSPDIEKSWEITGPSLSIDIEEKEAQEENSISAETPGPIQKRINRPLPNKSQRKMKVIDLSIDKF